MNTPEKPLYRIQREADEDYFSGWRGVRLTLIWLAIFGLLAVNSLW